MEKKDYIYFVQHNYIQAIASLGDIFGVALNRVNLKSGKDDPDRVLLYHNLKKKGYVDFESNYHHNEIDVSFELESPIGMVRGYVHPTYQEEFSLEYAVSLRKQAPQSFGGEYHLKYVNGSLTSRTMSCGLGYENNRYELRFTEHAVQLCKAYPMESITIKRLKKSSFKENLRLTHFKGGECETSILQYLGSLRHKGTIKFNFKGSEYESEEETIDPYYSLLQDVNIQKIKEALHTNDPAYFEFLEEFQDKFTFDGLPLYQNIATACYKPFYNDREVEFLTGVKPKVYQKNNRFISKLNDQK